MAISLNEPEAVKVAAEQCKMLIENGAIILELQFPSQVSFRFNDDVYARYKRSESDEAAFREILRKDLRQALIVIVTGSLFEGFNAPTNSEDERAYIDRARQITDAVASVFDEQSLRDWYQFKISAKDNIFSKLEWEVGIKYQDSEAGKSKPMPQANVRLYAYPPAFVERFYQVTPALRSLAIPQPETSNLGLSLHLRDVDVLISNLQRVRTALADMYTTLEQNND